MRTLIGIDDSITVRERRLLLLRHTFSGASVTPPDQGPSITTVTGTASVSGGVLAKTDGTELLIRRLGLRANVTQQVRFNFGNSAGSSRRVLLYARDDGSGNRLDITVSRTAGTVVLSSRAGFTPTTIASSSQTIADSTDYWVRWSAVGATHRVYWSVDGATWTEIISATSELYPSQGGVALALTDNAATPTVQADDWLIWRAP